MKTLITAIKRISLLFFLLTILSGNSLIKDLGTFKVPRSWAYLAFEVTGNQSYLGSICSVSDGRTYSVTARRHELLCVSGFLGTDPTYNLYLYDPGGVGSDGIPTRWSDHFSVRIPGSNRRIFLVRVKPGKYFPAFLSSSQNQKRTIHLANGNVPVFDARPGSITYAGTFGRRYTGRIQWRPGSFVKQLNRVGFKIPRKAISTAKPGNGISKCTISKPFSFSRSNNGKCTFSIQNKTYIGLR
ncbi:hypothetical protein [Coralliovum pocilloporae]|uniref:hypothetical protein n=1 Tax=Coralliovum pocilloporae TaxID=3066369 RepID=UPI00330720E5